MKRSIDMRIVITLGVLVAQFALAHEPGPPGFLDGRLQRIDNAINAEISIGKIPGAVALIMKDGDVAYHRSFGYADADSETPMQNDSIFRIASMTKAITSVAAMTLYERGYFRLNDPIAKYLPEFANMRVVSAVDEDGAVVTTVPAENPIRVIHLLTHTSGLGYPFIPSQVQRTYVDSGIIDGLTARDIDLASQMGLLATQPLLFEPGTDFAYGLNTDLLGYFVEVVGGKPLDQYFAEEIFEPLGMEDTYFYLPEDKADRLVTLYAAVDEGLVVSQGDEADIKLDDPRYPVDGARRYFSGGAGLSSTAYDYARFLQMLLNEGELDGVRILGRKSVELMRTARVDWDGDAVPDFGLGFRVVSDIGRQGEVGSIGSYSWGGAFNTTYWIDPVENLLAVYMSQARPTKSDMGDRFSTLVYQALE